MSAVNPVDAIKYGFELMAYLIAINLIGGVVATIGYGIMFGGVMMGGDSIAIAAIGGLFGFVIFILGYAAIIAGYLGIGYKVIADGVQKGVSEHS